MWNFCNETQLSSLRKGLPSTRWPSSSELMKLTSGSSSELGIASGTIQQIAYKYTVERISKRKSHLSWREARSLGWIPFKPDTFFVTGRGEGKYYGFAFKFWQSRDIVGVIKNGNFSQDARGRWYVNINCEISDFCGPVEFKEVGVDLGLKDAVVTSTGLKIKAPKYYRQYENKLAKAQRAGKKKLVRTLCAKVKNARKDFNHKLSTSLAKEFSSIVVGDVSSSELAKTTMAKSVYDVGWYQLKTFLKYKALARGSSYREVSEAYSTQMCAECGCIPESSPKGKKDLSVREWVCSECGSVNDRDVNAAKNILRFGHESPRKKASLFNGNSKKFSLKDVKSSLQSTEKEDSG